MSEMKIYWIGIVAFIALIILSKAKRPGDGTFLLSLMLIGAGYVAVLAHAFFGLNTLVWAAALTVAGMLIGRFSAYRGIPTVEWRARGFHSTAMMAAFGGMAFTTFITAPFTPGNTYRYVAVVYGLLAAYNSLVALHMAWLVIIGADDDYNYGYGDGYDPDRDYGQND